MSRLFRRTLVGVALGIILYIALLIYWGVDEFADIIGPSTWLAFSWALAGSSLNYALRFLKWALCLSWLGIHRDLNREGRRLSKSRSLAIYLAGLSMSVTPGKVGEVLRSSLLQASEGVPFARTAPVVVADRLSDLLALIVLSLVGMASFPEYWLYVAMLGILVVIAVVILGTPRICLALLRRVGALPRLSSIGQKAAALTTSASVLLRLRSLMLLTLISVVGWWLECVGYWWILSSFSSTEVGLRTCTFLWSTTTLVGALSFLPGGLGATEASLGVLVLELVPGLKAAAAVASTMLIRAATLWFGEVVGAFALVRLLRDSKFRDQTKQSLSQAKLLGEKSANPSTDHGGELASRAEQSSIPRNDKA